MNYTKTKDQSKNSSLKTALKPPLNSSSSESASNTSSNICIWLLIVAVYCYLIALRVSVNTINAEFMTSLKLSVSDFAIIIATSTYIYASMQIVVGSLLDTYGVRKCTLFFLSCATLAGLLFSQANGFWLALFLRILMMFGSTCGFLSCAFVINNIFSKQQVTTMLSATMVLSFLAGPFLGNTAFKYLVTYIGWQEGYFYLGILGLLLLGVVLIFMPNLQSHESQNNGPNGVDGSEQSQPFSIVIKQVPILLQNKSLWLIGLTGGLLYSPLALWGDSYGQTHFIKVFAVSGASASYAAWLLYVGYALGNFGVPFLAKKVGRGNSLMIALSAGTLILFYITLQGDLSQLHLFALAIVLGACLSPQVLVFSMAASLVPKNPGIAMSIVNFLLMSVCGILQYLYGLLLDILLSYYSHAVAYRSASVFLLALFVTGLSIIYQNRNRLGSVQAN